jgi:ABC-2 type transport system ATP-binding protein
VDSPQPRQAQRVLQTLPGVIALAQVGASLRVLAADREGLEREIDACLRNSDIRADLRAVQPNLEDVFVAATQRPVAPQAPT